MNDILPYAGEPAPSAPLFHYTGIEAFRSIIQKKELWLTDYRFLNDETEFKHGLRAIYDGIARLKIKEPNSHYTTMFNVALERALSIGEQKHPYVFCLTNKVDDLNQWRAYSEQTGRVAIGFDPNLLRRQATDGYDTDLFVIKYDRAFQNSHIDDILKSSFDRFFAQPESEPWADFTHRLLRAATFFKHHKFHEESEWRLVAEISMLNKLISTPMASYRSGRYGLTPYLAHRFDLKSIRVIYIGPSPHMDLQADAAREFLSSHGLSEVGVIKSEIPYRV